MPRFAFTDPESRFLSHWMYDECSTFWGPSIIWCWNNRIDWYRAPQPMAELFSEEEVEAGRLGWFFDRPAVPFEVPWSNADHFWQRAAAALDLIPRLQGGHGFEPASLLINVRGRLTPIEKEYLRAYNREMALTGSGHHITLCEQHGVLAHHLIPFFVLLDDLDRAPATMPAPFPWVGDFPARYEDLIGRPYEFPDHALIPR
jgi:hypothetical protein